MIEYFKQTGQAKRQSHKLTEEERYGNLSIDLNKLHEFNRLIAKKNSEIVIDQSVNDDFIYLITNRYNSRKIYSTESETIFKVLKQSLDNQNIRHHGSLTRLLIPVILKIP